MEQRSGSATVAPSRFVGRDRELDELRALLGDALGGQGALVLVVGEAGMGKTSMVNAFTAQAATAGARVLMGSCWSADDAPALLPWSQVVSGWLRGPDSSRALQSASVPLRRLLPDMFGDVDVDASRVSSNVPLEIAESHHERWSLFEAVSSLIRAAAEMVPIVIALDDLHGADVASVQLLGFLSSQVKSQRVLIVAAARDDELREGACRGAGGRGALIDPPRAARLGRLVPRTARTRGHRHRRLDGRRSPPPAAHRR